MGTATGTLHILSGQDGHPDDWGDRRIMWDPNDPEQVKDAEQRFNEARGRGWAAYAVDAKGRSSGQLGQREEIRRRDVPRCRAVGRCEKKAITALRPQNRRFAPSPRVNNIVLDMEKAATEIVNILMQTPGKSS